MCDQSCYHCGTGGFFLMTDFKLGALNEYDSRAALEITTVHVSLSWLQSRWIGNSAIFIHKN